MYRLIKAEPAGKRNIVLYGRDAEGNKRSFVNKMFQPYFYVPSAEKDLEDEAITSNQEEENWQTIYDDKVARIYTNSPFDVKRVRELFSKHFEADIPYPRRFLIDKDIYAGFDEEFHPVQAPQIDPKICYLDIEVYSKYGSMPSADKNMVVCIGLSDGQERVQFLLDMSVYGTKTEGDVIRFASETLLLRTFQHFMEQHNFDVITGWNIDFDMDYLKLRFKNFGMNLWLPGTSVFDLLTGYKKLYRRRSYRLADVSFDEELTNVREGKVDYAKLWNEDKQGLLDRNMNHVNWCVGIDKKLKVIPYYWNLKETAGLEDVRDTLYNSVLLDTLILRKAKDRWILPSRRYDIEPEAYEGAFVLQPKGGIYHNVAVFDLSRFYPNIILQEYLDPRILFLYEKKFSKAKVDSWDHYKQFAKDKDNLILGMVEELIAERDRLQREGHKDKVAAIKAVLNSVYGVMAFPKFRIHNMEIPSRITEVARTVITGLAQAVRTELGLNVIYMDTDSLFVENVDKAAIKDIEDKLHVMLKRWGNYSIKMDKFFVTCIMLDIKKRYAGLDEAGKIHITGFERVRTDSSVYTKQVQEEVMRMLLELKTKDDIVNYLDSIIKGLFSVSLRDIAVYKTLRRELSGYQKQQQYYIKAAKDLQKTQGISFREGDAVGIIPAKNYEFGAAVFKDIAELDGQDIDVNWDEIIEKQILRKVDALVALIGINVYDLYTPEKMKKKRKKKDA